MINCHFCKSNVSAYQEKPFSPSSKYYLCPICGYVKLTREAADDFDGEGFSPSDRGVFRIVNRNRHERRRGKPPKNESTLGDLYSDLNQYTSLDPIDLMDQALINLDRSTGYIGEVIKPNIGYDYPLYHCFVSNEMTQVLKLLIQENLLIAKDPLNPHHGLIISSKGYSQLRELKKSRKTSNQCFVAMWFADEMTDAFDNAIKPAIEYKEDGAKDPKYKAVKIDNVEHINDINDEIIAQIRRSRFMVCDLTGYRGGVYFEAGFAYGLGMDIIYTCRKDWSNKDNLKDKEGNLVEILFDSNDKPVEVRKEGVHFDLSHRNRIEWEMDSLDVFKTKLENRIKAVIV